MADEKNAGLDPRRFAHHPLSSYPFPQDNGSPTTSEDEPQPNEQTHKGLLNLAGRATRRANADNGGLMMLLLLLASVVPVIVAIYVFVFNDGSSGL